MKASIITVCLNSERTVKKTIISVNAQKFIDLEHIFIDGGSTDGTLEIIKKYAGKNAKILSERDAGIYDAMNKGVGLASGDFIGVLNSDDWYSDELVLNDVSSIFSNIDFDYVFGDIKMVSKDDSVFRVWKTGLKCEHKLSGRQIPHPAFFVRSNVMRKLSPPFDPSYHIAADLKQQLILINKNKCKGRYVPRTLVNMKMGGASTRNLGSYFQGWKESTQAYNDVFERGGLFFTLRKVSRKILGIRF